MSRISIVNKLWGIRGLDYFYGNNLKAGLAKDFLIEYLSNPYDPKYKKKYNIINYIIKIMRGQLLTFKELDELLCNSNYIMSMSDAEAYQFLVRMGILLDPNCISKIPKVRTVLSSKVKSFDDRLTLINRNTIANVDLLLTSIIEEGDLDELIRTKQVLINRDNIVLFDNILANSNLYSLDEFKKYAETGVVNASAVVDFVYNYYNKESNFEEKNRALDYLLEMANIEDKFNNDVNMIKFRKTGVSYRGFFYYAYVIASNPFYSEDFKNSLAQKLIDTANWKFMCAWLQFIESPLNVKMIDILLSFTPSVIVMMLLSVNAIYFEQATRNLMEKDKNVINAVISILCSEPNISDISRIDEILEVLFYVHPEYKISHDLIIKLIEAGSLYTYNFFKGEEFSEDERKHIYDYYICHECNLYLSLFGAFLHSGEKEKLLSSEEMEPLKEKILRERKKQD